jgi:hypothetical protein
MHLPRFAVHSSLIALSLSEGVTTMDEVRGNRRLLCVCEYLLTEGQRERGRECPFEGYNGGKKDRAELLRGDHSAKENDNEIGSLK